jgi:TRAP transporter TAXI family solute receptor
LKGKRVVVGPEGAGFEYFIRPILEEHGVKFGKDKSDSDFEPVNTGMISSVGQLQDGSVHATFLGGGIKSPAISNADSVMDVHLIPFDPDKRAALIERLPSFTAATIPAETYGGQTEPFAGLNVGSAQILVRSDADDQFVYDVTKLLFENLGKMAETIAAVKAVNASNVTRDTGVEFHPGAIRFYQELAEEAATESTEPPGKEATDEAKSDSGDAAK